MKKCKTEKAMWFANYATTEIHCGRTTGLKVAYRLKDAKDFMSDKFGYIIKQTDNGYRNDMSCKRNKNTLVEYCNGFVPSAVEKAHIDQLLGE